MLFVVVLLSLVGTTLTSSLSKRGGDQHTPLINCPTCEHHVCDINNLMKCEVCQISLHNDQPQDVKCTEAGHCHEDDHHRCCGNEGCVAQYFGQFASGAVTQPAYQSSIDGHTTNLTNQLLNDIHCPVCSHHICDPTNTNLCEACQIVFDGQQQPQDAKCLTMEHCKEEKNHICCTDMACVENVFGTIPNSGASLNRNKIYCPDCTKHGCDFISCETCVYHNHISHETQMHSFKTCEHKGECSHDDVICCHDYHCIDALFGTHFQSTLPSTQSTTIPSVTPKSTMQASASKEHTSSQATTILATTITQIFANLTYNTNATDALTTPTAATMTPTKAHNTTTDKPTSNITSSVTSNGQPTHHISSAETSTYSPSTTRQQSTAPPTTASSTKGQPTHHISSAETSTYSPSTTRQQSTAPPTTASSTQGTNNSCVDVLNNCAMFKSMGVCHASPQEGTKYDIAFHCKLTCDRCNETYQPLTTVTSTIPTTIGPTKAPIHCQVCGDYDNNIPCDLVSVYKGAFVACTEGAYCMNDVVHEQGNVKTFKRCVNEAVCRNLWMSQTSDQDHCTNYGNVMVSGDYSCHYCCTTDRCNRGLIPDPSTYYIKA